MKFRKHAFMILAATLATAAHAGLEHDPHPLADGAVTSATLAAPSPAPAAPSAAGQRVLDAAVPGRLDLSAQAPPPGSSRRRSFGTFAAFGKSDGDVLVGIVGATYHFDFNKTLGRHGTLTPFAELEVSYWEGKDGHTGISSLHEAGLIALVRYRYRKTPDSVIRPFLDLGLGLHYLTEDRIESKELGRHWLAGSNIGAGVLLGRNERLEAGLRIRHLSNAGTDEFNWGVNQILGRIALRF